MKADKSNNSQTVSNTGIPWLLRFFGPQGTALFEKPHYLPYCGLVDARISASKKDLPVSEEWKSFEKSC